MATFWLVLNLFLATVSVSGAVYVYFRYYDIVFRLDIVERSLQGAHAKIGNEIRKNASDVIEEVELYLQNRETQSGGSDDADLASLIQLFQMQQAPRVDPTTQRLDEIDGLLGHGGDGHDTSQED